MIEGDVQQFLCPYLVGFACIVVSVFFTVERMLERKAYQILYGFDFFAPLLYTKVVFSFDIIVCGRCGRVKVFGFPTGMTWCWTDRVTVFIDDADIFQSDGDGIVYGFNGFDDATADTVAPYFMVINDLSDFLMF